MKIALQSLFNNNIEQFTYLHRIKHYIFSHAGISRKWFEQFKKTIIELVPSLVNESNEYFIDNIPLFVENKKLRDFVFRVGEDSLGLYEWGGPLWCRLKTLNTYPLDNYIQVVGHTKIATKKIFSNVIALDVHDFQTYTFNIIT